MSEIKKQFFDTFGIEPFIYCSKTRLDCDARSKGFCRKDCEYYSGVLYPQITDSILLKLLSIQSYEKSYYTLSPFDSIDELKKDLLNEFIDGYTYNLYNDREDVKHQVQALFKEDN